MAISDLGQEFDASGEVNSAQPSLRVAVRADTSASRERVLAAGYDFSERRAQIWRNVKVRRLEVHERGDAWAEVTEGTMIVGVFWERCRYDWSEPGTVTATVLDCNVFRPGSTFELRRPAGGRRQCGRDEHHPQLPQRSQGHDCAVYQPPRGQTPVRVVSTHHACSDRENLDSRLDHQPREADAMSVWGRIFAAGYDHIMSGPEKATLRTHREALIPQAGGRVLEIGGGTGANLPFYADVEALTVTEPERPMVHRLERRLRELSPAALLVRAPAEDLPFADGSFDVAISTLVLCTVDDQPRALRELHRVLKPGGRLMFIEHVRANDQRLAGWQDRLNGLQTRLGHGCNCNRPTIETIIAAGFKITKLERDVLRKAPPIVRPLVVGVAQTNGQPA